MLRRKSVLALVERVSADSTDSECLGISHFHDIGLYTVTTEELPVLIGAASNFKKDQNTPALFHSFTFYNTTKTSLGELRVVSVEHHSDSASEFVDFLNAHMSDTRTTSILLL